MTLKWKGTVFLFALVFGITILAIQLLTNSKGLVFWFTVVVVGLPLLYLLVKIFVWDIASTVYEVREHFDKKRRGGK